MVFFAPEKSDIIQIIPNLNTKIKVILLCPKVA